MAGPDPSSTEVDRLRAVYDGYDRDDAARSRWDLANAGNRAIHRERGRRVAELATELAGPLLEVGCGQGQALAELTGMTPPPATRVGIDLSAARLAVAAGRLPDVGLVRAEAAALPVATAGVGTVVAFTLFSSVLDDTMARAIAAEMTRVLRPGGAVLWYDLRHGNPRNPAVRGWRRAEVAALFPGWDLHLRPVTVLPPLARRLGPLTDRAYPWLAQVRPLTTHLVGVVRRPG